MKQCKKKLFRNTIDKYLPSVASNGRRLRDWWKWFKIRPFKTIWNFSIYGDKGIDISCNESGEIKIIETFLDHGSVFVDIGANVGLFSCYASSKVHAVIAIEPDPRNVQLLCRNLHMNALKNVEVFPVALSDTVGIFPIFGAGQGASLLKGWGGIKSNYSTLIPVTTLDRMLNSQSADVPLFIKIDVEGNEYRLLLGARSILERKNVIWMLEHGLTKNFDDVNPHYKDLFALFWSHGYDSYSVGLCRQVFPHDVEKNLKAKHTETNMLNYLFLRSEFNFERLANLGIRNIIHNGDS